MRLILAACVFLIIGACSLGTSDSAGRNSSEAIREAIAAHNYGEAADLARAAIKATPKDASAYYQLARAEALLGNEGSAIAALQRSIAAGLQNAPQALDDPSFDNIRDRPAFAELLGRGLPGAHDKQLSAGSGPDRVEISTDAEGRESVRAGDVSLDENF